VGMPMKIIYLSESLPEEDVGRLGGKMFDHTMYDWIVNEDTDIFKPDGRPLLKFRKNVLPAQMIRDTFEIWEEAATVTDNRGMAAGLPEIDSEGKVKGFGKKAYLADGSSRFTPLKKDGTARKRSVANRVNSGLMGYVDGHNNPRFPYCRMTAFNVNNMEKFKACMPLLQTIDRLFAELMPEQHKAQMEYHTRSSDDFKIPGTSFTTITCNRNFRTAIHCDKGDLKQGFGVMTAMWKGVHKGGFLGFPKYRVAVNMQTCDLLLADVHEFHGNDEIKGIPGMWTRLSLVCYFREAIASCSNAEQERLKAIEKTENLYARQDAKPEKELF
jgi:hypothetical protein